MLGAGKHAPAEPISPLQKKPPSGLSATLCRNCCVSWSGSEYMLVPRPAHEKSTVASGAAGAADELGKRPLNWRATRSARTPAGSVAWGVMGGEAIEGGRGGKAAGRARRTAVEHEPEVGV